MAVYLREFATQAAYEAAQSSLMLPNVSLIDETNDVEYNPSSPEPPSDQRLIAVYNVTDTSEPTQLYFYLTSPFVIKGSDMFTKIEIDGVEQQVSEIDSDGGSYLFTTPGEHTVAYSLSDPTFIGVEINQGTREIEKLGAVFMQCQNLKNVIIPDSVIEIGSQAFMGCNGLTSCTIGNNVEAIGNSVFQGCSSLTSIVISDSVIGIGMQCFYGCTGLTNVVIGSGLTHISLATFSGCRSLTSCTIGIGVTGIDIEAFKNCSSLTSIVIPGGVTSIGQSAFSSCSGLTSVTVNATTPPTLGEDAFDSNASGRKIYVPAASVDTYKSAEGWSEYAADILPIQ